MKPEEIREKGKWFNDLLAGAGGAFDATLLDLPTFIASKVAPEAVKRLKESKGYKAGHTAGSVTGALTQGPARMISGAIQDPTFRNTMAGIAQANLFGAPEWAAKKLEGKTLFGKEILPAGAVEAFKKEAGPAYGVGQVAGTVGSALIPTGQLVKGVGALGKGGAALAKGFKGIETALGATKFGKIIPAAVGSAVESGLQSAARAGFGGKSAGETLKEAGTGALLGGATAGVLTGAGQIVGRGLKELSKRANRILLGLTDATGRDMNAALKVMAGPTAKGFGLQKYAGELAEDTADLIAKKGLHIPAKLDEALDIQRKTWDKISSAADMAFPQKTGGEVINELFKDADIDEMIAMTGKNKATIAQAMDELMKGAGGARGAANIRNSLFEAIKRGRFTPPGNDALLGEAMADVAKVVRDRFDDAALDAFQAAGGKFPDGGFPQFKKEYRLLEPLARGDARMDIKPIRGAPGSTTAEKSLMMGLLGAGGGFASGGEDVGERLKRAGIGALAGVGGNVLGKLGAGVVGRGLAAARPLVSAATNLAPQIGDAMTKLAPAAGKLAAAGAQKTLFPEDEGPEVPGTPEAEASAAGTEAGEALASGDAATYEQKITSRLSDVWDQFGAEQIMPGQKAAFMQYIFQATDGFAPEKTAGILYQDPAERESYLKALGVSRAVENTFETAANRPSALDFLPGVGENAQDKLNREAAEQSVLGAVSEVAPKGVTPKMVQGIVEQILKGRGSASEKRKRLEAALKNYGVDFDLLRKAGIV